MKVILPLTISDAMVTSTVSDTDGVDGAVWSSGTTYAIGAVVRREGTHHSYESLVGSNLNNVPEDTLGGTVPKWVDLGSTNKWRMLRTDSNLQTTGTSPVTVAITPGQRVSAIGILRLEADAIQITTSDGYDSGVMPLRFRDTHSWSDYFFGDFLYQGNVLLLDLPRSTSATITVAITRTTGGVLCGPIVLGTPVELGKVESGVKVGSRDFSGTGRDDFGNATLIPRKAVPRTSQNTMFPIAQVNNVRRAMQAVRARTALYVGVENAADAFFDALAVLGIATNWEISLDDLINAYLSIDLEGL